MRFAAAWEQGLLVEVQTFADQSHCAQLLFLMRFVDELTRNQMVREENESDGVHGPTSYPRSPHYSFWTMARRRERLGSA